MNKKAIRLWGKAKYEYWFKTTGVGPFSMALLEDIVDLCELVYPDGVTEDDDESDTDTTVTTEHAHTESCGKGCSETVYDDDTTTETTQGRPTSSTSTPVGSGNGDGFGKTVGETTTESPAPKDTDSSTTDSETEETEEEERAEHTDTDGHPIVSSPNWATAATSMAAAGVTGEAGSERATLAVVGAAFALVVAGVVAMRRRSRRGRAAAAYEPI